jgi:hypothetical protein
MKERDPFSFGADAWVFVDEPQAGGSTPDAVLDRAWP